MPAVARFAGHFRALTPWLHRQKIANCRHPAGGEAKLNTRAVALAFALLAGCSSPAPSDSSTVALPDTAGQVDAAAKPDAKAANGADSAADADSSAANPDTAADSLPDAGPANLPPQFQPIAPLTLDQGASATVDLAPLLSDPEDAVSALKLSWSAPHVALKDPGSHALYVVAPVNWAGSEDIAITAKDSGGLTAAQTLHVTVKPVQAPDPAPYKDCAPITFSVDAGKGEHTVWLSGTFNGWAATADKADALSDPKNTGTWTLDKKLPAGVQQYKFIVDGKWLADKANPNQTPDGFGGMNSVIEVVACAP